MAELYNGVFRKDYPDVDPEQARIVLVEASPEIFSMFKEDIRAYTEKALEKRGVEVMTGEVVESVSPERVTLKSGTVLSAHTLVWGAGLQGNALVRSLGLELERGNRIAVDARAANPVAPGGVRDRRHRGDHRCQDGAGAAAARLGRAAVGRARRARPSPGTVAGKETEAVQVQGQGHDGHDRPGRRRGADARRQDDEGEERPSWRGGPCTSRCCRPTRTAPRRWSTGPARD